MIALITGSSSGIGLGIAKAFAAAGYNLCLNGLEKNGPEIAAKIASTYQVEAIFNNANMLKSEELREMVAECQGKLGGLDVLVCNAGIQYVSPLEDFPDVKWEAIIGINLSSAFYLSKAVWPIMKVQGRGRIIMIASAHGLVASEFKSAYVAAKHGIVGLTKTLALEGAPFGITANAICPGYVKTPLVEQQISDQAKAHQLSEADVISKIMLAKQAIKDFVPVEDIAAIALMLASDQGKLISGTALPIDGGWTAQ